VGTVYLIPSLLHEEGLASLPPYLTEAIKDCSTFFVENERTTRRFFKLLWKEMVIDDHEWFLMDGSEAMKKKFKEQLSSGKNIGIVSEAGCPGIADPGQQLIQIAQEQNILIKPMVGPNSILLALMASGMNGQQFQFLGYLPVDAQQRAKAIKDLENESARRNATQIFIETPYRNNQMFESLLKTCNGSTRICLAVDLTAKNEWIKTRTVNEWRKEKVDFHKRPAIFLVFAGQ
jgi:16S rRNA (cytidine1402-2'-O)-methyltransferase